jgi:hypothetical protein
MKNVKMGLGHDLNLGDMNSHSILSAKPLETWSIGRQR